MAGFWQEVKDGTGAWLNKVKAYGGPRRLFVLTFDVGYHDEAYAKIKEKWDKQYSHHGDLIVLGPGAELKGVEEAPCYRIKERVADCRIEVSAPTAQEAVELHRYLTKNLKAESTTA